MKVEARIEIEKQIVRQLLNDALISGFTVSVDHGGDCYALRHSVKIDDIMSALMNTDRNEVVFHDKNGQPAGWSRLVYGNDGYDVIANYEIDISKPGSDAIFQGAIELSENLKEKYA